MRLPVPSNEYSDPARPWNEVENGLAWSPDGDRLVFGFLDLQETKPVTQVAAGRGRWPQGHAPHTRYNVSGL